MKDKSEIDRYHNFKFVRFAIFSTADRLDELANSVELD